MLRVLDQNGASRVISPSQVQPRRENKAFSVAEDADGHDMKVGDAMKERAGEVRHFLSISSQTDLCRPGTAK